MRKSDNYFVLAFGVCFLIMACIQIRLDGLLPAWVFFAIAFVSINLNVYSIFKNLWHYFQDVLNKNMKKYFKSQIKVRIVIVKRRNFRYNNMKKEKNNGIKCLARLTLFLIFL